MSDTKISEAAVIETLLQLAFAAWCVADDGEELPDGSVRVSRVNIDSLSSHLDTLDKLPDEPGYACEAAAKARWALRELLNPQPAELSFDVEAMLAVCVPGGSIVDPQVVADNIRAWAAERKPAELAEASGNSGELAEQQGDGRERFEAWAESENYPIRRGFGPADDYDFVETRRMWQAWQAALAATGKQQVNPAWSLHDRVEFALRDAGFDLDEASRIALQIDGKQQVGENCEHCENGIAINSNFRTEEPCRQCQQVGEVQGERERFEAWARTQLLVGRSGSISPSGQIAWQAWQAAIAARQPVCGTCAEVIQPNALTGTTCGCARQPGAQETPPTVREEAVKFFTANPGLAEYYLRKHLGMGRCEAPPPAFYLDAGTWMQVRVPMTKHRDVRVLRHGFDHGDTELVPFYAAPPAQGIDLCPVREFLRRRMAQWRSHLPSDPGAPGTVAISDDGEGGYNNDVRMYREGIALMGRVLALIDGERDAAPGVG